MADTAKDPVYGMTISPEAAVAREEHEGRMFYLCSDGCHAAFVRDPNRYPDQ